MAILFAAGEDEAIDVLGGSVVTGGGGSLYRTAYARCALKPSGSGLQHTFRGDLAAYLASQPANDYDFWYGFRFRGGGGFISGLDMFYIYDGLGPFLRLTGNGSASGMTLWTSGNHGGTWTNYPASDLVQPGSPTQIAFRFKLHPTLGDISMYFAGAFWFKLPFTNTAGFGMPIKMRWFTPNSNGDGYYSEFIATTADDPVVGLDLSTLVPTAIGFHNGWGGPVVNINEIVKNTSTLVTAGATGLQTTYSLTDIASLGGSNIVRAFIISGEFSVSASSLATQVKGLLRISGADFSSALQTINNVLELRQFIFQTSPATTAQFLEAEVNGLEAGMESA